MKTKIFHLKLTGEQCYLICCFLTGQLQKNIKGKERKILNNNIVLLLKKMEVPYFGRYHELVESVDWDKVKENAIELNRVLIKEGKKFTKKKYDGKGSGSWHNLYRLLEKYK